MDFIPISKIEDLELPVPSAWRPALKALADFIVLGTVLCPTKGVVVGAIKDDVVRINRENIETYPDKLGRLTETSWRSSICVWNDPYWAVLLDLTTDTGDVSDLVLQARVIERSADYLIKPGLVYVP